MADYIGVPLETNPDNLANQVFDELEAEVPGWVPSDGAMDTRLINAFAGIAAETRDLASAVPDTIFATFGKAFMNLPQIQGAASQILSTWTARDNVGYTIPQGTLVQGTDSLGIVRFWETYQDYTIPAASTSVANVILVALNLGADANGITYLSGQVVLVDDLEFISTVVTNSASSGGADAEDDQAYLNRLRADLQLLTPRPILPGDFSVLAMNQAGIVRAVTLDGYDPGTSSFGNAREVTVYVAGANGIDPGFGIRTALSTYLESLREANFIVNVQSANIIAVPVTYTVKALAGFDHAQLLSDINAAITNFLNPGSWGGPEIGESPVWTNVTSVYFFAMAAVIQDVPGVDHLTTLLINGVAADYSLAGGGPVALPTPGTLTGTIT